MDTSRTLNKKIGKVAGTMRNTPKKTALTQTAEEYASQSSIHGIGYVFDRDLNTVDRLLWLFLVLAFAAVAAALTWNFWVQWRNEQVIKRDEQVIKTKELNLKGYQFSL